MSAPAPPDVAKIIADLYQADCPIPDIARSHSLTNAQLLAVLDSPECRRELAAIREIERRREEVVRSHARSVAIDTLRAIALASPNHETARRAAATLLRCDSLTSPSSAAAKPANPHPTAAKPRPRSHAPGRAKPTLHPCAFSAAPPSIPSPRLRAPHVAPSAPPLPHDRPPEAQRDTTTIGGMPKALSGHGVTPDIPMPTKTWACNPDAIPP